MLRWVRIDVIRYLFFFFFNDTATTEIYTLSLHDALPIYSMVRDAVALGTSPEDALVMASLNPATWHRSEEHTSELQSQSNLVCRLLLEKKKISRPHTTASAIISHPVCDTLERSSRLTDY